MSAVKLNVAFVCIYQPRHAITWTSRAASVVPPTLESGERRASGSGASVPGIHLTALGG
jgi:hypothetical protein